MVKQANGEDGPSLVTRELLERANFAVQASTYLQQLGSSSSGLTSTSAPRCDIDSKTQSENDKNKIADFSGLARNEIKAFKKWSVHTQIKLDPSLKRTLCTCNTVLVPGLTCRVRRHKDRIAHSCIVCGATRYLPLRGGGDMDDIVPKRRRGKKVPFHERERPAPAGGESEVGKKGKRKQSDRGVSGHVLWRGKERCAGWGVLQESKEKPPDAAEPAKPDDVEPTSSASPSRMEVSKNHERTARKGNKPTVNGAPEPAKEPTPEELEEMACNG